MLTESAIKLCCANGHAGRYEGRETAHTRNEMIIPMVMAAITYCDIRAKLGRRNMAAAADKLRDFATVELLCADLGITRKDLN